MQQGSVSPNILTGPATGPPRFTAPDAIMAPGMHAGASFVPRAPGVGQSPRLHWQTEPLYRAEQHRAELQRAEQQRAEQHRASAPQPAAAAAPAAAPKTEPKKKTLLVFTNPDSGAAVDIPVKEEKSKTAGVTSANVRVNIRVYPMTSGFAFCITSTILQYHTELCLNNLNVSGLLSN